MIDQLIANARDGVEARRKVQPQSELAVAIRDPSQQRPFNETLSSGGLSLIAEFKRRSPSSGEIADRDLATQVGAYERGGASALSVLTDSTNFGGSLEDLKLARSHCGLPILRKDFIIDPYQLYEAVSAGADAILLIVRALDDEQFAELHGTAQELDLDCLVEVHNADELERALDHGAEVIGINNRDLDTGVVDLQTTFDLMPDVPAGKIVVAESGISDRDQLEALAEIGVDAALIGTALMRADDPEAAVGDLAHGEEGTREHKLP